MARTGSFGTSLNPFGAGAPADLSKYEIAKPPTAPTVAPPPGYLPQPNIPGVSIPAVTYTPEAQRAHDLAGQLQGVPGSGGVYDPYNLAARYTADPSLAYQDPRDLLSQIEAAVMADKYQVNLPSGDLFATNQETIDLINFNIQNNAAMERRGAIRGS